MNAVGSSLEARVEAAYDSWLRDRPNLIAIDTETDGSFYPFCVTVAWEGEAHYIEPPTAASRLLLDTPRWVFHNAKFDLKALLDAGVIEPDDIYPDRFEDTETIVHLLNEHEKRGLKHLAEKLLGETTDEAQVLHAAFRKLKLKKSDGFDKLPREVLIPYAIKDADFTFRLFYELKPDLILHDDLCKLYGLERELTLALLDMELAGMGLDMAYLEERSKAYRKEQLELELKLRELAGYEEFKPGSPKQVQEVLAKRGIEVVQTSKDALLPHKGDVFVDALLEYRRIQKLSSTYFEALRKEQKGGILHPNFRQHGTKTGRMSSGKVEE